MSESRDRLLNEVRERALERDYRRRQILSERQAVESTLASLEEMTTLERGELEQILRGAQRDMREQRKSLEGRPSVAGFAVVLCVAIALLVVGNRWQAESAPAPTGATRPAPTASAPPSPPREVSRPARTRAQAEPEPRMPVRTIEGISPQAQVWMFGIKDAALTQEQETRYRQARMDLAFGGRVAAISAGADANRLPTARLEAPQRPVGRVEIALPVTEHPIVLVLSSRHAVIWSVRPGYERQVSHVILSGEPSVRVPSEHPASRIFSLSYSSVDATLVRFA
ncbi:MAG: hypothetical protein MJE66_23810, partial [Proteobacteria bacterium]|nr:hypothetical protein [Pseudomonadota bacterium]